MAADADAGRQGSDDTSTDSTTDPAGDDAGAERLLADAVAADDEVAKWKSLARQHENAAKKNARELEALRKAQMTDQEKAIEQARWEADQAARADERGKAGGRLVAAEFRAALAGRVDAKKLPDLLAGINHAQFLDEHGDVNGKAVQAFADAIAPAKPPSFDSGARGGPAQGTDMNTLIRRAAGVSTT